MGKNIIEKKGHEYLEVLSDETLKIILKENEEQLIGGKVDDQILKTGSLIKGILNLRRGEKNSEDWTVEIIQQLTKEYSTLIDSIVNDSDKLEDQEKKLEDNWSVGTSKEINFLLNEIAKNNKRKNEIKTILEELKKINQT